MWAGSPQTLTVSPGAALFTPPWIVRYAEPGAPPAQFDGVAAPSESTMIVAPKAAAAVSARAATTTTGNIATRNRIESSFDRTVTIFPMGAPHKLRDAANRWHPRVKPGLRLSYPRVSTVSTTGCDERDRGLVSTLDEGRNYRPSGRERGGFGLGH